MALILPSDTALPLLPAKPPRGWRYGTSSARPTIQKFPNTNFARRVHMRRLLRDQFLAAISDAWATAGYVNPATFAAMAAAFSPWLNWKRESITLTDFQAFQVWWSMYFGPYANGVFEPHTQPPPPYDFQPIFNPAYTWSNPTNPITLPLYNVQIEYNGPPGTQLFLIELYAAPNGVIRADQDTRDLYYTHLYATAGGGTPAKISMNITPSAWQNYPFQTPTKPTTVAFRPNIGQVPTWPGPVAHYGPPTDQVIYSLLIP